MHMALLFLMKGIYNMYNKVNLNCNLSRGGFKMDNTRTATRSHKKDIFSKDVAVYLIKRDVQLLNVRSDVKRMGYVVFEFLNDDKLDQALSQYKRATR